MEETERLKLIKEALEQALKKAKEGEQSSFIIITEKSTGKYVQVSVMAGENEIVLDVPEGVFDPKELERISNILKEAGYRHKAAIGLTVWVDNVEKAAKMINEGFKRVLNLGNDYDIEIETT